MKHTLRPWSQGGVNEVDPGEVRIYGSDKDSYGPHIASVWGDTDEEGEDRAELVCACVNACEGINPEAVPDLLEACQQTLIWLDDPMRTTNHRARLKAAIQKATAPVEG